MELATARATATTTTPAVTTIKPQKKAAHASLKRGKEWAQYLNLAPNIVIHHANPIPCCINYFFKVTSDT
jgi:hypothetical protein